MSAPHDAAVSGPVPRPPWSYARVVKTSRTLSPRAKLVWLEHFGLWNTSAGCTASAAVLGRRIATSRVTVDRLRSVFIAVALLHKQDRGPGRTAAWRVTLPLPARPASARITDDQCAALAEQLDAHLVARVNAAQSALTPRERLAPLLLPAGPTEKRALHPLSYESGLRHEQPVTAGEAGEAGDAGSESKDGLRGEIAHEDSESAHAAAAYGPPAWLTDLPVYMPSEPDELVDEERDTP